MADIALVPATKWGVIRNIKWTDQLHFNTKAHLKGDEKYPLHPKLIPFKENLRLIDGTLMFVITGDLPPWLRDKKGNPLIVTTDTWKLTIVPESKKKEVMKAYFEDPMLGGFKGRTSLHQKLRAVSLGLSQKDITQFLSTQEIAQLTKPASKQTRVVKPLTEQNAPFHYWQCDLIDLKAFQDGKIGAHKYILSVIDIFSKFCWFRPMTNKSGPTVAKAFRDILLDWGAPKILGTDNGSEFVSTEFKEMMSKFGIEQRFGTAYVSSSQGQVERANGAFKKILFDFFITTNTSNFTNKARDIQYCINNSVARHGLTPHQVMFGRDIGTQAPLSAQLGQIVSIDTAAPIPDDDEPGGEIYPNQEIIGVNDEGQDVVEQITTGLTKKEIKAASTNFKAVAKFTGEPSKAEVAEYAASLQEVRAHLNKEVKQTIVANADKMVEASKSKQKGEAPQLEVGDIVRISMNIQEKAEWRLKGLVETRYKWSKSYFQVDTVYDADDPVRHGLFMLNAKGEERDDMFTVTRRCIRAELQKVSVSQAEDRVAYTRARSVGATKADRVLRPAGVQKV